jgi:lactoylglutathione lyase
VAANVTGAFPILAVTDLGRALAFYRDLLGGRLTYRFPDEGEPVFATVELGGCLLGLGEEPGATDLPHGAPPRFELCAYAEDCDAAIAALRRAGVTIIDEPADQEWGERMARVADPDGNRIMILSALPGRAG